jgi:hypothetical protein
MAEVERRRGQNYKVFAIEIHFPEPLMPDRRDYIKININV